MTWSDAARAAAAEARRIHSQHLKKVITSGIKDPLTIAALRGVAARTLRHNRGTLGKLMPHGPVRRELMYHTAEASVRIRKNQMVEAMKRFSKRYSRGTNPAKFL